MNQLRFKRFLQQDRKSDGHTLAEAAIATRIRRAQEAEDILGRSLDEVVRDDAAMRSALVRLRQEPRECIHAPRQNALRKYYRMVTGREFPRLRHT